MIHIDYINGFLIGIPLAIVLIGFLEWKYPPPDYAKYERERKERESKRRGQS